MAGDTFEDHWPRYPSDGSSHKVMDVIAECDVDKLFKLQWDSSSEFLAKSQEVRGNKDFVATPWVGSADEVEAAAKTANSATPDQSLEASEYEGKLRKTTCNSFGMGMKFQTFEVQRCVEAKVGKEYTMNTCVMTTATYGEKFRPVFKYKLTAEGDKQCRCQVEYQLVYVTSVNAFIKKAIERGASNGITKNFETVQEVLKDFVAIRDASKAPVVKPSAPVRTGDAGDAAPKAPPQPTGPRQPWWTGVMDRRFVKSFEPLATFTKSLVNAGGTPPPRDGVSLTATGMALTLMVFSIFCLRAVLHGVHAWLVSFTGISGWMFRTTIGWMDIPDSLCEVVLSFWLLVATHTALSHLAAFASDVLSSPDQPTVATTKVSDSDAPDGTRYDGYDDAYNDASSTLAEAGSPNGSTKGVQLGSHVIGTHRHRDVWNQQIKESNEKAKTQIKHGFREFKRIMGGMGHQERQEEKKEEKKETKSRRRLRRHSRNGSDVSLDSLDLEHSASSASSAVAAPSGKPAASSSFKPVTSETVVRAPAPAPSRDQATGAPLPASTVAAPAAAVPGGSNSVASAKAVPGVSSPKAIRAQQSPSSGTVTSVMTPLLEKTDNMLASWGAQLGLSRGAATQGRSGDSPVASQTEAPVRGDNVEPEANNSVTNAVVPILEKTDEYLASWGITRNVSNAKSERESMLQPGSPPIIYSADNTASPSVENGSDREPLQINASRHKTYSESELAEMETAAGPVQEEVFENERFQPFKGWGHNWPGHFLPTDRIGHWSHRDGTPGKAASMAFSTVAPKLPKGWSWVEEGWVVDTQGIADDAVDVDGWSYATDFGWLHMPPAAGSGKFRKVRDYVRRRRWVRSRVRKPAEQQPGTAISSAANSPVFGTFSSSTDPSGMYVTHDDPITGNASFSSQRSGYAGAIAPSAGSQPHLGHLRVNSSHMGGVESSTASERPYMNLSDVRQGLSAECNKWGSSTVSELHKAISSTGDDVGSLARDSMRSDDYVGNSPMSAGLQRLSGPTAFPSGSGPPGAAPFPSAGSTLPSGSGQPFAARPSPQFVTVSTPQTMGTAGGLPVAPELANATGHANIPAVSRPPAAPHGTATSGNFPPQQMPAPLMENRSAGGVPVQNTAAEGFPAKEELTVEGSAGSAPSAMFGQIKPGRLGMPNSEPHESLPASAVAAAFLGPSQGPEIMQSSEPPVGHHHAYEKAGVVLPRPADGSAPALEQ